MELGHLLVPLCLMLSLGLWHGCNHCEHGTGHFEILVSIPIYIPLKQQ